MQIKFGDKHCHGYSTGFKSTNHNPCKDPVIFFYFALERTSETVKLVYLQNNRDWKNKIEKSRENFIEKGAERKYTVTECEELF